MAKKFFGDVELKAGLKLSNFTTERALIIDANGDLVVSPVTSAELAHVSGVTSDIQTQLDAKIDTTEKGANNGVATLGANGKIPQAQIPAIAITEVFSAADIAARDALTVGSGVGEIQEGDVVIVTDASADPNVTSGAASYIYDGTAYQRLQTPDSPVDSVNGQTGVVVLDSDDISEGTVNLYYTEARFDTSFAGKSTTDLTEGTNLYYTEARFDTSFAGKSTTDLTEGTNLYYTEARFDTSFAGKSAADLNYTQTTPADWTLADGSSIALTLDEVGGRLTTLEGGSTDTKQILISANDTTEGYLEDKVVVAQGTNTTDILEVSTLNDGLDEDLQIQIDQTKIDHDQLLNFVANEHIDWTIDAGVDVADANISETSVTQHEAALTLTASQVSDFDTEVSNNVDVAANTAARHDAVTLNAGQVTQDSANLVGQELELVEATTTTAGVMSASDKSKLDGLSSGSSGDISETAFAGAQSASAANVTGFAFANATVRSFRALAHVEIDATADLFEVFYMEGIQTASGWSMTVSSTGDDSLVTFDISATGQITYSSSTYAGFASMDITFRAITTSV